VDYYAKRVVKWRWLIYPWALNEDITAFLERLKPAPVTLEEAQKRLAETFNIRIPLKRLVEIYPVQRSSP
jgi:hypothetical protein